MIVFLFVVGIVIVSIILVGLYRLGVGIEETWRAQVFRRRYEDLIWTELDAREEMKEASRQYREEVYRYLHERDR